MITRKTFVYNRNLKVKFKDITQFINYKKYDVIRDQIILMQNMYVLILYNKQVEK